MEKRIFVEMTVGESAMLCGSLIEVTKQLQGSHADAASAIQQVSKRMMKAGFTNKPIMIGDEDKDGIDNDVPPLHAAIQAIHMTGANIGDVVNVLYGLEGGQIDWHEYGVQK